MTDFKCWDESQPREMGRVVQTSFAYLAAEKFVARYNEEVLEFPLMRTVCVEHREGFIDVFEVELISKPQYMAKRKK